VYQSPYCCIKVRCSAVFAARCYARAAYIVMRCLSVCVTCLSVRLSRSWIPSKRIKVFSNFFSPSRSQAILVFPYQTAWQYSDWNPPPPPKGGVECRWGRQKSRFWAYISGFTACCQRCDQPGVINTAPPVHGPQVVILIAGSKRRSLLMAGDDEMFRMRSLNVTPKTTEQRI